MTPEELCRRHHLLGALEPAELRELLAQVRTRRFVAGETVFLKDDPGDGLYGVLEGCEVVTLESESGKELILNQFSAGEFFGEIALLDGKDAQRPPPPGSHRTCSSFLGAAFCRFSKRALRSPSG